MATVLYARVSTAEQTIDHQLAHAKAAGFAIDEVVADNGVSGLHTRLVERPEGKRLFDKLRAGDVLVVRWVDRLGRNYEDVCDTIREFMRRGVVIRTVINNFTFDGATKDPMQQAVRDALIGFMAATAQAQAGLSPLAGGLGRPAQKTHQQLAYECRSGPIGGPRQGPLGSHLGTVANWVPFCGCSVDLVPLQWVGGITGNYCRSRFVLPGCDGRPPGGPPLSIPPLAPDAIRQPGGCLFATPATGLQAGAGHQGVGTLLTHARPAER